jgi:hypothetical protein
MPRFFFHLDSPDGRIADPDGMDFADPDEAWEAARITARDLMRSEPDADVAWLRCSFVVVDEAGEIVFEFPFVEAIDPPPLAS